MNTVFNSLKMIDNMIYTENGAAAHKTTGSRVYDMFAVGGAYRKRSSEDCVLLFKEAYEENATLALKCLFYMRDVRGGQGERRFFRECFKWLIQADVDAARRNLLNISEYGRWDDLIYTCLDTSLEKEMMEIILKQLNLDVTCKAPSLLGKWMPSINASARATVAAAKHFCKAFHMTEKQYRKMLSGLRHKINVLEKLMSSNQWDKIEFDKIPSKAGLIYKNAFARRDIIAKKYETFAKSKDTKVNAAALYPYEIVQKAVEKFKYDYHGWGNYSIKFDCSDVDRAMINKYWANLPDYIHNSDKSMLCVIDTSGSMHGTPINVAISLGLYAAERCKGAFANHYISFASRPQFIETRGVDFVDKVSRIYATNLVDNTNLIAVFDLLESIAMKPGVNKNDMPDTITIISDMQIDGGAFDYGYSKYNLLSDMERVRIKWKRLGLKMPKLVYWNVDARGDANILDLSDNVSYVSGFSPVLFEQVLSGKTGYDLMVDKLMSKRYEAIK